MLSLFVLSLGLLVGADIVGWAVTTSVWTDLVVFAVVELLFLPFLAQGYLADRPLVAGAWMALSVKTDGAAVASGAITESLIYAKAAAGGVNWAKGWILGTSATVKVFIDIFIGRNAHSMRGSRRSPRKSRRWRPRTSRSCRSRRS